jgi:hypothetical protein
MNIKYSGTNSKNMSHIPKNIFIIYVASEASIVMETRSGPLADPAELGCN